MEFQVLPVLLILQIRETPFLLLVLKKLKLVLWFRHNQTLPVQPAQNNQIGLQKSLTARGDSDICDVAPWHCNRSQGLIRGYFAYQLKISLSKAFSVSCHSTGENLALFNAWEQHTNIFLRRGKKAIEALQFGQNFEFKIGLTHVGSSTKQN